MCLFADKVARVSRVGRPATTRDGLAFSHYRGVSGARASDRNLLLRAYRHRGIIVRGEGGGGVATARSISHSRGFTLVHHHRPRDRSLAITFATNIDFRFDPLPGLIRRKTKKKPRISFAIISSSLLPQIEQFFSQTARTNHVPLLQP